MAMIRQSESWVGSQIRLDGTAPRTTWPKRYVRITLGTDDEKQATHNMDTDTARMLGRALLAEAKLIDAKPRR